MKKQTFIKGSMILMLLGFISRAMGVFFKVPLDYMVGEEGQGLYYILYPVYATLISMASIGLTVALSRQIATYTARDKKDYAWAVFQIGFKMFLLFGVIFSLCIWLGSPTIIKMLKWPTATYWGMMGLVFAPFLISMVSAFRGLFQGHENMVPTGISMIIEQFTRVVVGIGLTWYIMNISSDIGMAVGGATFGATAGGAVALIYLVREFIKYKNSLVENTNHISSGDKDIIFKDLIRIAIPVAFGSAVISIMSLVDSIMLPSILTELTSSSQKSLELIGGYSRANTIINIPLIIAISISTSIVPFVTKAWEKGEGDVVIRRVDMGMKIGTFLAFPAAIGMAILSERLISLIFSSNVGYEVLIPLAFSLILMIYAQIQTNVLVAINSPIIPVITMLMGVVVKVVMNLLLLQSPNTNLVEVGIAVFISYLVIVILNEIFVYKKTKYKANLVQQFIKPTTSVILMGIVIYIVLFGFQWMDNLEISVINDKLISLFAILVGGVVYLISIVKMKYLSSSDMAQIPILSKLDRMIG